MQLLVLIASTLPLAALAGSHHEGSLRRRAHHHAARNVSSHIARGKTYTLQDNYSGSSFFDGWDFYTDSDPTHGAVNFLSQSDAAAAGLAFVQSDNTVVLGVDDTTSLPPNSNRNSVRITTKKQYNGGLFIADFFAAPHGCGTWPAYWSVGPDWPNGGEIDVLEAVHNSEHNQMTLHTATGCALDPTPQPLATTAKLSTTAAFTSQVLGTTCASSNGDNNGCGFLDPDTSSFGHGFNTLAGGVFAHLWNSGGISVWHWPRGSIPADITAGNPDPSGWPTPQAFWSASSCDMSQHFYDHSLVLDITLCGDWAGAAYAQSGCPGTCASAVQDPSNFSLAKFKINYIKVYN